MKNKIKPYLPFIFSVILIAIFLFMYGNIGASKGSLEKDARKSQHIDSSWEIAKSVNETLGVLLFYDKNTYDYTYSIYVNHPGISYGYFFREGGGFVGLENGPVQFTNEQGSAIFSLNQDKISRIEFGNKNLLPIMIDPSKPFTALIPDHSESITMYDINEVIVPFANVIVGETMTNLVPTHLSNNITATLPKPTITVEASLNDTPTEVIRDFEDCFEGFNGCAVIYNTNENEYNFYNKELCNIQTTPCSTFKIISTLMGLQKDVINSEDSKLGYSGVNYPVSEWNSDVTLKEAFQYSCIWYYRKIIDEVGKESVQEQLDTLSYGNCDISSWEGSNANSLPDLNGFWLESSLKISPTEQVRVLTSIFEGKSNYSVEDIEILKHIMKADNNEDIKLYGKTGAGVHNNSWYVGFFEVDDEIHYFAVHLDDATKSRVTGADAKQITLNIINKYYRVQ